MLTWKDGQNRRFKIMRDSRSCSFRPFGNSRNLGNIARQYYLPTMRTLVLRGGTLNIER
jgi:hypothetical protein